MRAKDYFKRVLAAETELKMIRAKIRHYQDIGYSITGGSMDSPVVSHSRGSSRVESAAMGIFDATRALEEQMKEYLSVIREAERIVSQVPQMKYREILTLKYMAGWSFRSISDELHYEDPKSIYKAHGYALSAAQKIIDKIGGDHR